MKEIYDGFYFKYNIWYFQTDSITPKAVQVSRKKLISVNEFYTSSG